MTNLSFYDPLNLVDKLLGRYRQSINPPWNLRDYFNLVFTLTILLTIPLTTILLQNQQTIQSQAQTIDTTDPTYPCCVKPGTFEVVTGAVTIEPNVYDESGVAKVELRFRDQNDPLNVRGTQYVFADTEAPYQFPWDSTKLPDGRQRYDIQAWDIYGNGDNSYLAAGFLAMNDPNYPSISIITPSPGSTVTGIVPIEISTSANNGIVGVYIDEELTPGGGFNKRVTAFTSAPYRYEWDSSSYPDGLHRFRIRSFEHDKFSYGDLGDPGQLIFEVCVRSCVQPSPTASSSPTPTPTPSPTPSPTPTPRQSTYGTITGTIYSSTGQLVSGAKITLRVNNKNTTYFSDAQGKYIIPNLPPGTYSITYVAAGYSQQKTTATVTAGQTLVINVTLKPK